MAIKMSYKGSGENCPGHGQGPMGGTSESYVTLTGPKKVSGSAQKKSGNKGMSNRGNRPGPGSSHMASEPAGGRKGYSGHSGMMRMGNSD